MNHVLDYLNLKIKTINQKIPKVQNIFEHKYNQQYG